MVLAAVVNRLIERPIIQQPLDNLDICAALLLMFAAAAARRRNGIANSLVNLDISAPTLPLMLHVSGCLRQGEQTRSYRHSNLD
jgi:hypothetical protein